ncbi:MAG: hypothetical protein RR286_05615 [Mucinivorans sp.]
MKKLTTIALLLLAAMSVRAQYIDDLYGTPIKRGKGGKQTDQKTSEANHYTVVNRQDETFQGSETQNTELVTSKGEAAARRYEALNSTTDHNESYWVMMENYYNYLVSKYNQDIYNIIQLGDRMWVEPRTITALLDGPEALKPVKESLLVTSKPKTETTYNVYINDYNPYSFWGGFGSFGLSFGWGRPYYAWGGGGYYPPYWGGGYYPPYWGGGYYPPYWGGGYYPPYWGGGCYPNYPNYNHSGRPTYYGNSHNGSYYGNGGGGGRPMSPNLNPNTPNRGQNSGAFGGGSGFKRPAVVNNRPATQPITKPSYTDSRDYRNNTQPTVTPPVQQPSMPSMGNPVGGGFGGGGGAHRR